MKLNVLSLFVGMRVMREACKRGWSQVVELEMRKGKPLEPPKKKFKPKVPLPTLENYREDPPEGFWSLFPKNLTFPGKSLVDADRFEELLREYKVVSPLIKPVLNDLRHGAVLGCKGYYRLPSKSSNAKSAIEHGRQTTDAIASWVTKGFVYGPVEECELPSDAKINGIMCVPKPNGAVRVINNLSAPEGQSVNEGIDKEEFPAPMSSTTRWLRVLHKAGPGCWIFKCDWSDAYKHLHVADADVSLQWFSWLGKYFAELCLIFGGTSSVGLYDRLAKLVCLLVRKVAQFPADMMEQHLDDNFGAAPAESRALHRLDSAYQWVAKEIGVQLAPRDDPGKSFAPCHSGVILGVDYDTKAWTWAIPQERLDRILRTLHEVLEADSVELKVLESLVGKILHVRPLVPDGRFYVDKLLKAQAMARERSGSIRITSELRGQLGYWRVMLPVCSGRLPIPDPDRGLPAWALEVYTDAAGGSLRSPGLGVGAVCDGWWVYMPWSKCINWGAKDENGKMLGRKLSFLELLGPLLVLAAGARMCANRPVRVWVDNAGSVHIWRKGYSTACSYSTAVARAIAVVARGLGCRVEISKITRCSTPGAEMADALSKGAFGRFLGLWRGPFPEAAVIPRALRGWLESPDVSADLGASILAELV